MVCGSKIWFLMKSHIKEVNLFNVYGLEQCLDTHWATNKQVQNRPPSKQKDKNELQNYNKLEENSPLVESYIACMKPWKS